VGIIHCIDDHRYLELGSGTSNSDSNATFTDPSLDSFTTYADFENEMK